MITTHAFHAQLLAAIDTHRAGRMPDTTRLGISEPGLSIYANTGLVACAAALEANFRGVAQRLGQPSFHSLAIRYAREHPARDTRLFLYGQSFPQFLRDADPCSDGLILSELGCLDWLWMQAHVASDSTPLNYTRCGALDPETLASQVLQLAPATHWHGHVQLPIWQLWSTARSFNCDRSVNPTHGEAVLFTRPDDDVLACSLNVGGCTFLHACSLGLTLAEASETALQQAPETDLHQLLSLLFAQGAFRERDPTIPLPTNHL